MPIEEALERVESYIEKEEVPRLRNVKKLAAMFAASPAPKVPSAKPGTVQQLSDDRFSAHNGIASDADELNKIADQVARGAI